MHLHQLDFFTYLSLTVCTDNLNTEHCQDAVEVIAFFFFFLQ